MMIKTKTSVPLFNVHILLRIKVTPRAVSACAYCRFQVSSLRGALKCRSQRALIDTAIVYESELPNIDPREL